MDFREEIKRRKSERREQRSNNWISFILKLLAFAAIILVMRYLGQIKAKRISFLMQNNLPDTTKVINIE
jgi:hypothetical protein